MLVKKTKYALKALVYLAKEYQKGPILIQTISEKERIPKKFLEAILLELKIAGILGSKKGKGGGYYLIKHPKEVNMADIHRLFEGPIALSPCVSYKYYQKCEECIDENTCGIRAVIKEIHVLMVNKMKESSLEQIICSENNLF
jgi:Rrf2 family protein